MSAIETITSRVFSHGPDSLSDDEILSLFTGEDSCGLVSEVGHLGYLADLGPVQLVDLGLSRVPAARLASLREMSRRLGRRRDIRITSPRSAGVYLLERCKGWTEERMGLLALDAKGAVLADRIVSQGTATACIISPREIYREALKYGAVSILIYHNHPSGAPDPSREDVLLTKRIRGAGETLGIPLADHIIVGEDTYHSFRAAEGWDQAL